LRLADTRHAVGEGAAEIDMVISRGAFLEGDYVRVSDEIAAVKEACGGAHLKVIFETGELQTYDHVPLRQPARDRGGGRISSRPRPARLPRPQPSR
jgi:deoxyribose-phosphate aldolase